MKKIVRSMIMVFAMMLVVIGAKAEAFAKTCTQKINSSTSIIYTYELESGSSTEVALKKVEIKNPTSDMTINVPESISDNGKVYKIVRICDVAFQNLPIKTIKLPMSTKYIDRGAFHCMQTCFKTIYIPESIKSVNEQGFDCAAGCYTSLENLYIRKSSGDVAINSPEIVKSYIDKMYFVDKEDNERFKVCDSKGNEIGSGILELFDSLANSKLMRGISYTYAKQIVKEIIPSGMSEGQRMQMIYNYVVTNARYCWIYSAGKEMLALNQTSFGTLFFHSSVCAGRAFAVNDLAKAAGLNIEYVHSKDHGWSIFRPSNEKEYRVVDTCGSVCMVGTKGVTYTPVPEDAAKYKMSKDYYGDCIEVVVDNKSNVPFNICLHETNYSNRKYINYVAKQYKKGTVIKVADIVKNARQEMYAYAHAYYNFRIDQNGKNCLNLDIALNRGKKFESTFKDAKGVSHKYTIEYIEDGRWNTKYGSAYVITIN